MKSAPGLLRGALLAWIITVRFYSVQGQCLLHVQNVVLNIDNQRDTSPPAST